MTTIWPFGAFLLLAAYSDISMALFTGSVNLMEGTFTCKSMSISKTFDISKLCDSKKDCFSMHEKLRIKHKCTYDCPIYDGKTCTNHGACIQHKCICNKGWIGPNCSQPSTAPPKEEPCNPSPCGPYSQCGVVNGQAVCSCLPEFIGSPPTCRTECTISSECPRDKACIRSKCRDPCEGTCGQNALCSVVNYVLNCNCSNGMTGNASVLSSTIEESPSPDPCPVNTVALHQCNGDVTNFTCRSANRVSYGISELPLNYDGSKRTGCVAGAQEGSQPPDRMDSSMRLRQLRSEMVRITSVQGPPLDGYIVTSDDDHQSETVAPHDMRREFLTGFYGSAGEAVVTLNKAVLWTDVRYHLQADQQLDCNWTLMRQGREDVKVPSIAEWLAREFMNFTEARIGADPMLISAITWQQWETQLAYSTVKLIPVSNNLIDVIWQVDRPNYNPHGAYAFRTEYSGKPWQEKVQRVRREMEIIGADALVVTALDEIAWLLNIRGYDLPYTPVLRSYVIVTHGTVHLYAPEQKVPLSVDIHLKMDSCYHADCVKWHNYTSIWDDLRTMSEAWNAVWLPAICGNAQGASRRIYASIPPEKRLPKASPIIHLRVKKNNVEAEGMRKAHIRDAVAMCNFLAYMEEQMQLDSAGWDEMQVARVANEFRLKQNLSKGIACPTIAGYGVHAALPHYMPSKKSSLPIGRNSTLIVDSGGQYLDGTTDVTRTLHYGEPTREQKEAYTRVLIGSIQLASLTFPRDLRTDQLDILARGPLWSAGLDYMHGTGHGIGHFSSVHEPPIIISYTSGRPMNLRCNTVRLRPGYFFSNEPGYYKENNFGVRLENIIEVIEAEPSSSGGQRFLKFADVTLVPYEPKLIDVEMLSPAHRRWLNNYNRRIRDQVGAELKRTLRTKTFSWMMEKTRSIPE